VRSGYIAIIGKPNVGKSTLLNGLLQDKIAAVSPKPQTTRQRIIGIANGPDYQMLFLDTPGLLDAPAGAQPQPRHALRKMMEREVAAALNDADVVLLVVEPFEPAAQDVLRAGTPLRALSPSATVVAINKIDKVTKPEILPVMQSYVNLGFETIVPISALTGDGIVELCAAIKAKLPEGEPYYPTDQLTTQPEKFFVAELVRETIFARYGEEIPYSTIVEIAEFKEQPGRKDLIKAVIYVERDSQKAIVIGRKGEALKRLGSLAREKIEAFLGRPVYLELWVKVRPGWRRDETFIREQFRQ
jgi:GTP-binding protein Era